MIFFAIAYSEALRNEEKDLEKQKDPSGPFDSPGFSKNLQALAEHKVKELKNGNVSLVHAC